MPVLDVKGEPAKLYGANNKASNPAESAYHRQRVAAGVSQNRSTSHRKNP